MLKENWSTNFGADKEHVKRDLVWLNWVHVRNIKEHDASELGVSSETN